MGRGERTESMYWGPWRKEGMKISTLPQTQLPVNKHFLTAIPLLALLVPFPSKMSLLCPASDCKVVFFLLMPACKVLFSTVNHTLFHNSHIFHNKVTGQV